MNTFNLLLLLALTTLSACSRSGSSNPDPFYREKGGGDYARLPLIKPYEVWYLNDHYNLLAGGGTVVVRKLLLLGVEGGIVYGKADSQDIEVAGKTYKGTNNGDWYCLSLKDGELSWYLSEAGLKDSLRRQIGRNPDEPVRMPDLFEEFRKKGSCKWFPKVRN